MPKTVPTIVLVLPTLEAGLSLAWRRLFVSREREAADEMECHRRARLEEEVVGCVHDADQLSMHPREEGSWDPADQASWDLMGICIQEDEGTRCRGVMIVLGINWVQG